MKELNRTKRLSIASVFFVLIIVVGLITFSMPEYQYQISNEVMLEELYNIDNEMLPDEAMEILMYEDSTYQFIDLRLPAEFYKGALGNAINIPVSDILDESNMEFYQELEKDSVTMIFYAGNQLDANGPWMLLKQLGINNIQVLLGGYDYLSNDEIDYYDVPEIPEYFVEEPILDFAVFMEEAGNMAIEEPAQEQKVVQPIKRKKKIISEGGC